MADEKAKKKRGPINPHVGTRPATLEKYKLFARKYVETNNGSNSAIFAGYERSNSYNAAVRLLKIPEVQNLIADYRAELMKNTDITAEMVLRRHWELANVDVNDMVQYRRYACRYCFGEQFAYQWIDENEYWMAYALAAEKYPEDPTKLPTDEGGYGYTRHNAPNPDCPRCDGVGDGAMVINDTTTLTGSTRALYDGVEETKNGLKVKLRDRDKHLDAVGRILGLYKDNVALTSPDGSMSPSRPLDEMTDEQLAAIIAGKGANSDGA